MNAEKLAFIAQHGPAVIRATRGTGLFPSVMMAQMILESSGPDADGVWRIGRGLTVRKANNYFGIKADSRWTGPKVLLPTSRDGGSGYSWFRMYPDVEASIRDRCAFLQQNSRYAAAGVFAARTPWEQVQALVRGHYAQAPNYDKVLWREIDGYNLTVLDDATGALSVLGVLIGVGVIVAGGYAAHRLGLLPVPRPLQRLLPS